MDQKAAPLILHLGKWSPSRPRPPLNRTLDSRLGVSEKRRESFLPLPGIEPRFVGCPVCGLVTTVTELFRLPCIAVISEYLVCDVGMTSCVGTGNGERGRERERESVCVCARVRAWLDGPTDG